MWRKKKWEQKESGIEKSHLPADPAHMMISIPLKYAAVGRAGRSKTINTLTTKAITSNTISAAHPLSQKP